MPLFCAYCGKSFSRKEHLERHIPTHTNVKPYRCEFCQMSFARKDLLNRHTTTYHEPASYMEPAPGVASAVSGRTPIACQNCATAKTGCDKRVPCSRCAEKGLPCEARYARRSMKAALRAAQVTAAYNHQIAAHGQREQPQQITSAQLPDVSNDLRRRHSAGSMSETPSLHTKVNPRISDHQLGRSPHTEIGHEQFCSTGSGIDGVDDLMAFHADFPLSDSSYQDFVAWPDFPVDFDMYTHSMPVMSLDVPVTGFTQLSDISSTSDPTCSSSRQSTHTRGTSVVELEGGLTSLDQASMYTSAAMTTDFDPVIAAEPAWPLARCNPPIFSGACPRTAITHLENLERSKDELIWAPLEAYLEQMNWNDADFGSVIPMSMRSRDRMLAITQSFLHKALEIHRRGINDLPRAGHPSPEAFNFIVLPPTKVIEFFLRNFVRSTAHYFPLIATGCLDPNDMVINDQASTLLVLLMVAQGATTVPRAEAQDLAAGLTETCRLSLFDMIEKDVGLSADPVVLRCALLFTILGAWSGDKWLMDIAMGQRGMYLAMLKHSGMLEPQQPTMPVLNCTNTELQWRTWIHHEGRNRLVYNWVMVDQELSLFHDTPPTLSLTDLRCSLPSSEALWMSPDANQWYENSQALYGATMDVNPQLLSNTMVTPSLHQLFQDFLHDNLLRRQDMLSPQQLRLLLHPLHSLLCNVRQVLSCFSQAHHPPTSTVTKAATISRLEEIKPLLQKWFQMAMVCQEANPECQTTRISLVLYHLISLNVATDFLEIERLARREDLESSFWDLSARHGKCIFNRDDALFHCGQVFRLLRLIPSDRRPCWWSTAVYRATMILWTEAIARLDRSLQKQWTQNSPQISPSESLQPYSTGDITMNTSSSSSGAQIPIDRITCEAELRQGVPVLTRRDGAYISLDKPPDILSYGTMIIDEAPCTRIGHGLKRKIVALGRNWGGEVPVTMAG